MVQYKNYVAGWLDSSIHNLLQVFPLDSASMKYALITCIDSNTDPHSLINKSPQLKSLNPYARSLKKGFFVPTKTLVEADSDSQIFFGFDEVWFFPKASITPKPESAWLVGPARINKKKLVKLGKWMSNNSCSMALGDGDGLNFIVKARGFVRHLLGHSIEQQRPNGITVASHTKSLSG